MFTLRCTQKLLRRMRLFPEDLKDAETPEPTTALGDWYAHLLILQRQHLVIFVSERSRLCLLIPARDMDRLTQRFLNALLVLLREISVPKAAIERERAAMESMCYGLTTGTPNGRSVLGTINDYTHMLRYYDLNEHSLPELSLRLSKTPVGPLKMQYPREVALSLFAAGHE